MSKPDLAQRQSILGRPRAATPPQPLLRAVVYLAGGLAVLLLFVWWLCWMFPYG